MKKRLLSLVLCLTMLLPTLVLFTSCGSEAEKDFGTIEPVTIVIAMMTDEQTTQKGIEAAEKVLNQISESNLNTHIELKLYTEDEYYAKLEEALYARYYAVEVEGDKSTSIGDVEDVTFDEEKNREVTAYPEMYENQIDIFYVDSKTKLEEYRYWLPEGVTREEFEKDPYNVDTIQLVAILDESAINESAPLLSKYLSANLLNAGKVYQQGTGELCAIPSNAIYDEAEYMLVDKKYFDESVYNIDEVTNLLSLENYLIDFVEKHPDVQPVYNLGSMGFVSLTGKNSVISQYVATGATADAVGLEPKTMLGAATLRSALISMQKYLPLSNEKADPITGSVIPEEILNNGKFAVGYVSADPEEIEAYEENYYVIESNKAVINSEQACGNMFAVSNYTSDVDRCLEVINMIQTNEEFHNALTYGEEQVTYSVNQTTGLIERVKDGDTVYMMDINRTGNLFITAQNSDMSEQELKYSANDWELAKAASRHAFFSPYVGFELAVFNGEEIFDDPNTEDVNESNNPTNLPTTKEIDFLEEQYNWLMKEIFDYDEAVDAETGEPLYLTYAAYLDALDAQVRARLLPEYEALQKVEDTEEPAIAAQDSEDTSTPDAPATGEPTTGEPVTGKGEPKEITYPSVVASQLVATAGQKNIYRQFLDWRKIRFVAAS
ncbi:MAG: hypothetical protein IJX47_09260 [Clostridia bacterium]|nr:hypothetical protein [Clostridia bacterium]